MDAGRKVSMRDKFNLMVYVDGEGKEHVATPAELSAAMLAARGVVQPAVKAMVWRMAESLARIEDSPVKLLLTGQLDALMKSFGVAIRSMERAGRVSIERAEELAWMSEEEREAAVSDALKRRRSARGEDSENEEQ